MRIIKFNYRYLRGKIREVYGTEAAFATALGMGRVSLSQRLNNLIEFSPREILRACELLNIPSEKIHAYFFLEEVQKSEQPGGVATHET